MLEEVRVQAGTGKGGGFEGNPGNGNSTRQGQVEAGKFGLWWGMASGLGHKTGKDVTCLEGQAQKIGVHLVGSVQR